MVHTHDVTPFVPLLVTHRFQQQQQEEKHRGRIQSVTIPIIYSCSMNALFGDPCLGTTKSLRVSYYFDIENASSHLSLGKEDESRGKSDRKRKKFARLQLVLLLHKIATKKQMTFSQIQRKKEDGK